MRSGGGLRIGLLGVALAAAWGCRTTSDEQAAVHACQRWGNASEQCRMANRMLSSGAPNVAQALQAEEHARQAEQQRQAEATRREQEMAAKGEDPCDMLRQKLAADHPAAACTPKIGEVVDWLKDDPGCAAALEDPEGTELTAADLLGDCDTAP